MKEAKLTHYDNFSDYIKYLCQQKGVTITKMCKDLGFNQLGFMTNYKRKRLKRDRLLKVAEYLNADITLLMTLPLLSELKKERKDNENG